MSRALASLALALAAAGCIPEDGPLMKPGSDCLECHGGHHGSGGGEEEEDGPAWTFAGTVFSAPDAPTSAGVRGVAVRVTDASGKTVTVRSNQAGNFYLADGLAFPLRAAIERGGVTRAMTGPITYGGCNSCHRPGGAFDGWLTAP